MLLSMQNKFCEACYPRPEGRGITAQAGKEYLKQKTEVATKFKNALELFSKDFFKLVPLVKRIEWTQYTPYFNDGDSCEFSVNEHRVPFNGIKIKWEEKVM